MIYFEVFNTRSFLNASIYSLKFKWNDGSEATYHFDVLPLTKSEVKVPLGKEVDGNLSVIVETIDQNNKVVSEEQIIIKEYVRDLEGNKPLPDNFKVSEGKVSIELNNGEVLTSFAQYHPLYRVATDNDTDVMFVNKMKPFYNQKEEVIMINKLENAYEVVTQISNKKNKYIVTDRYEGHDEGIIVTSRIHPISSKGVLPRFGMCFRLQSSFDDVSYLGRSGETYFDMRDQFVIKENKKKVIEMTEPNIRPQESGNRMDCRYVTLSSKDNKVTFEALKSPFELAIKPYSDLELLNMKHRTDEVRSGTYVTIEAFEQGISSGSCGPYVRDQFLFKCDKDYEFKYLIKLK